MIQINLPILLRTMIKLSFIAMHLNLTNWQFNLVSDYSGWSD